jgi:hypothetical protein
VTVFLCGTNEESEEVPTPAFDVEAHLAEIRKMGARPEVVEAYGAVLRSDNDDDTIRAFKTFLTVLGPIRGESYAESANHQ